MPKPNTIENVTAKWVEKIPFHGCWEWTGHCGKDGYGRVSYKHRLISAHRFVYTRIVGEIPAGLQLDHLCRNRGCVNPSHLEPVTARENTRRSPLSPTAINSRKTHCPGGHLLSGSNLYVCRKGKRYCKMCKLAATKLVRSQKKGA